MRDNKRFLQTSVYYTLIFMATSSFMSYVPIFYAEIGITEFQIGILTSISAVIALFANPFWGTRGDRARSKNRVLLFCLAASALSIWLIPLTSQNFWLQFLATCVFFFFQSAVNPLGDTISLDLAQRYHFRFSHVRTAGSLGFAIMSLIGGWMITYNIYFIFAAFSVLIAFAFIVFMQLPEVQGYQSAKEPLRFWEVLRNRQLIYIYLYVLVLSTGFGFFMSFHALYSVEKGISTGLLGAGIMLGSFSQFPFMLLFDKLYDRLGIRLMMIGAGVLSAIRWLLYSFWLNSYTLLLLWVLHGGTFIIVYLCLTEFVHRHIRKELKASGQMMNFIIQHGIGRIIGGTLGGIFAQRFGFAPVFAAIGVLTTLAVIIYGLFTKAEAASTTHDSDTAAV